MWEIKRVPKPLGVKISDGGFSTSRTARQAGITTLRRLLQQIKLQEARCGIPGEAPTADQRAETAHKEAESD